MRIIAATSSGRRVTYQTKMGETVTVKVKQKFWDKAPKRRVMIDPKIEGAINDVFKMWKDDHRQGLAEAA